MHAGFISIEYNSIWADSIVLARCHRHKLFSKVSHYVFFTLSHYVSVRKKTLCDPWRIDLWWWHLARTKKRGHMLLSPIEIKTVCAVSTIAAEPS